jgi:hypothetical protein
MLDRIKKINEQLFSLAPVRRSGDLLSLYFSEDLGRDWALADTLATYELALNKGLPYWDVRAAARCMANVLKPTTYLEVGTRRGWSLAQVFDEHAAVRAYVCDSWVAEYGDFEQGSPDYIVRKMRTIVGSQVEPWIEFLSGNSHDPLPAWFSGDLAGVSMSPAFFDLATIDGDHTRLGAWWDLVDVIPRIAVGGALIFDDIDELGEGEATPPATSMYGRPELPGSVSTLMDIWLYIQKRYPNFLYWMPEGMKYRAAIALRLC